MSELTPEALEDIIEQHDTRIQNLKKALKDLWKIKCFRTECRAYSHQVNHSYCKMHKIIAEALERENERAI